MSNPSTPDEALQVYGPNLYLHLVSAYAQDSIELLDRLKTSLHSQDMAKSAEAARSLRKVAEIVGAAPVCDIARGLESAALSHRFVVVGELIRRFETENARFLKTSIEQDHR